MVRVKKIIPFLMVIAAIVATWVYFYKQEKPIAVTTYICKDGKTIQAEFYKGENIVVKPGEMPIPTGKVALKLSDNRALTIPQTISGSGIRYANKDESFIFWNKGDGAFIIENNKETYSDCSAPKN